VCDPNAGSTFRPLDVTHRLRTSLRLVVVILMVALGLAAGAVTSAQADRWPADLWERFDRLVEHWGAVALTTAFHHPNARPREEGSYKARLYRPTENHSCYRPRSGYFNTLPQTGDNGAAFAIYCSPRGSPRVSIASRTSNSVFRNSRCFSLKSFNSPAGSSFSSASMMTRSFFLLVVLTMAEVGTFSGALRKSAATDVRIECPMSVGMEPQGSSLVPRPQSFIL